jgi:hypothetical protein
MPTTINVGPSARPINLGAKKAAPEVKRWGIPRYISQPPDLYDIINSISHLHAATTCIEFYQRHRIPRGRVENGRVAGGEAARNRGIPTPEERLRFGERVYILIYSHEVTLTQLHCTLQWSMLEGRS